MRAGGLPLEQIFDLFPNLKERLNSQGTKLSGGEQQMLAIARILRTGASFLMLDEPTEGLAPVIIQQIGHTIARLKKEGFTILLVEQNFRFASTVADRYYVMEHGRIIDGFANSELAANMDKLHDLSRRLCGTKSNGQEKIHKGRSMMTKSIASFLLGTALTLTAAGAAFAQDKTVKIGVLTDSRASTPTSAARAPRSRRRWRSRIPACREGLEDRRHLRRSPEQAGRRHRHRPPVVRRRQGRRHHRRAEFRRRARGQRRRQGQERRLHQLGRGGVRPHRRGMHANTVHWTYDTYMLANGTGKAMVKAGGDTWFFLTADYAFGQALERDTTAVVNANGGKVLGGVKHPLNTPDFSSFLLQAQASKAKIIGLANAGGDTINSIKQAAEFGIVKGGQKLAALLVFVTDVNALGLETAQGLTFTETFYWDMNDQTRAFSKRFSASA